MCFASKDISLAPLQHFFSGKKGENVRRRSIKKEKALHGTLKKEKGETEARVGREND